MGTIQASQAANLDDWSQDVAAPSWQPHEPPMAAGELVVRHAWLVRRIAAQIAPGLPPALQQEDLEQAGMIALLQAAGQFDPTRGARFETYATTRVRGAMLDEVRKLEWAPRSVHRNARLLQRAFEEAAANGGRAPASRDIAAALDVSTDTVHEWSHDAFLRRMSSLDAMPADGDAPVHRVGAEVAGPMEQLQRAEQRSDLERALGRLPQREREVFHFRNVRDMSFREISHLLGVSESRAWQLNARALERLREFLDD